MIPDPATNPAATPVTVHDPAIVPSGPREAIDGHRLLQRAVGFGRALRAAGLPIDLAAVSLGAAWRGGAVEQGGDAVSGAARLDLAIDLGGVSAGLPAALVGLFGPAAPLERVSCWHGCPGDTPSCQLRSPAPVA